VTYPSPGGTSGTMRGYLVQPNGPGPFSAVLVIHENRGLNPYIEDVARQAATEGFLALAPDGQARRRSKSSRPLLRCGGRDAGCAGNQGTPADPIAENDERQRFVAGPRGGSEGVRCPVRDAYVSRYSARLSQQLDATLPGAGGQAGLGADDRFLQQVPRLKARTASFEIVSNHFVRCLIHLCVLT
jgi:hypothetical protein